MKKYRAIIYLLVLPVLMILLYFGGIIGYAMITDYRPEPTETLTLDTDTSQTLVADSLTIVSWNIGYGGLGAESDFFYDGGKTVRMPQAIVEKNFEGIRKTIEDLRDSTDAFLLQEVDRASKRSWNADQFLTLQEVLNGYASTFSTNYQVKFIPIPFGEPMGRVHGGLASFTRFQPREAIRHSFEGNYDWPTYLFFLDRCFLMERVSTPDGKELVLVNTHNSAYDDGSLKQRQMEQMKSVLLKEYAKGNYVIVGGDWNQYPSNYRGHPGFELEKNEANARFFVAEDYPASDWTWAWDPATPTNRNLATSYLPESTPRVVIDYFLLSPNVELVSVGAIDAEFAYSDHNPVKLQVRLGKPGPAS